jgi:DNA-binding response OmpR family regulator
MVGPNGKRVLIGEDDPEQRELLGEVLALEGYQVDLADNPSSVVNQIAHAELAILDLNGVSSPEVAEALAAAEPRPKLLLVSGDPELKGAALRLRADGYLAKPYDLDRLLQQVASLSGRV